MAIGTLLLTTLGAVLAAFVALWLLSLPLRNASIVDPFWGAAFALIAWVAWAAVGAPVDARLLLVGLVTLWGLRLSVFLLWRNAGHGEDFRYVAMRERHGARFPWVSLGTVFALQAVLAWVIALPVSLALLSGSAPSWPLAAPGLALWGIGLVFEAGGDWQLARFKADPANAGKVMDRGLWGLTRHPNYFGDFTVWWGHFLVALSLGAPWWTVVGPALMSFLLMRVSGVTLLERDIDERRPDYARYKRQVRAFFPGPRLRP